MVDTFTPKIGLRQYDASLFYDVSKFSADNLLVDNAMGAVICTSTTRPSTGLFNGMTLWETDTRRFVVRVAGGWTVVPGRAIIADQTARAAITTPYDGMVIWRQDRDWHEVYDGAAWRVIGTAHCASVADRDGASGITNPFNGQMAVTQDTDTIWEYDSTTWVMVGGSMMPRGRIFDSGFLSANSGTFGTSETLLWSITHVSEGSGRDYVSKISSGWTMSGGTATFIVRWVAGNGPVNTGHTAAWSWRQAPQVTSGFNRINPGDVMINAIPSGNVTVGLFAFSDGPTDGQLLAASNNLRRWFVIDEGA